MMKKALSLIMTVALMLGLLAADPAAGRLCNRFGHAPAPDSPRSPTRTTSRPPGLAGSWS